MRVEAETNSADYSMHMNEENKLDTQHIERKS
ncbi:hypothetical protein SAMN05192555_102359 [Franzmannia pantelleriensis]|uniref:Uncharacterized protein n=1 Tax=Franzmannia pantelleriensis TaxID=48727 RepID=A0A1G9H5V2_9GAMM|nr:hypothetical protein SAMN05192555_102359 [Halomonas pantelleriensis]